MPPLQRKTTFFDIHDKASRKKYHRRWRQHRAITVETVDTVDIVDTVDMVYTVDTIKVGFNSSF